MTMICLLGYRDKEDYDHFFEVFFKYFFNLKKEGLLNRNFSSTKKETEKRIIYFDYVRKSMNSLDWILFDNEERTFDEFMTDVSEKYHLDKTTFMQIFGSMLIFNILIYFGNVENLFLTMLKGVKCDDGDKITGKETLRPLLEKIFKLDKKEVLPKSEIQNILNTKFRNSLAHGWFRIENTQLTYFEDAVDSKPIVMDEIEILGRLYVLRNFVRALSHLVLSKNWNE